MGKNNNRAHSQDDDKTSKEEGMMHLIECNGDGVNGNGCVAWTSIWLPMKLPRGFNERRFLCGFCAMAEVEQMKEKLAKSQQTSQPDQVLRSVLSSDAIEQYGRRDNIRIFGVADVPDEDPYNTVIKVASEAGVTINRSDISVCHRLPARIGPKPIIAKFVRREVKTALMRGKGHLKRKQSNIFINDDITPLRSKLSKVLRDKEEVKYVNFLNEKITVTYSNNDRVIYNNLFDLYKALPTDVLSVCKSMPNFQ